MGTTDIQRRLIPLRIQRMRLGFDHYHPIMRKLMEIPYQESSSDWHGGKNPKLCYKWRRHRNRIRNSIPRKVEIMDEDSSSDSSEEDGESISGPEIPEETSKLFITIRDWSRASAKDLLLFLNPFLPEDGRILSVAVYPKDPVVEGYHAVAKCDSSATADYLYNKSRHGIESEFERCSNKLLDFRFIPDDLEFIQSPCDVATQEPDRVKLMQISQSSEAKG